MKIMRMTDKGIELFTQFLDELRSGTEKKLPEELLKRGEFAEEIGGDVKWLSELELEDKLKTAKQLNDIIENLGLKSAERDVGFWAWCSAFLFKKLCKKVKNKYKPGELPIWIPQPDNWQRYYRHYLASIWRVYLAHRDKEDELVVLLSGPVNTPGELWGQFASGKKNITNPTIIDMLYHLYWDEEKNKRKYGAGGESPRRLRDVLKQFERTWDFYTMTGYQVIEMLPGEFNRFK